MEPRTSLPDGLFHPAVAGWFGGRFAVPTPAQAEAWPAIRAGAHVLIAAPTGSGKTLAAFLAAIDDLVRQAVAGALPDQTQVVYVSPLKALSNDIQRNLEAPLAGIRAALQAHGLREVEIRTAVRTGDTPAAERARTSRRPPHIEVTTPESLYLLLGSASGRALLATVRSVIVDEIHALAPNKRGAHLALSLERLRALCGDGLQRVGLSATVRPVEAVARFLVGAPAGGAPEPACRIIDTGHHRARDLALELPPAPLEAVMSNEVWEQTYDRLATLVETHRTSLVFVNTRRMAERVAHQLSKRCDPAAVAAHHGSLAKEHRLDAEQRLKRGALKVLVATASLELGIDIGEVDLVCQLGSPRSIASFLQRVGRSGHAVGATPKGRLFPLSRDELVECTALLASVKRGELDRLSVPLQPLDVLAQQIVAEVAAQEWSEDALYDLIRHAAPYRALPRADFDAVLRMLAEGFATSRGRRGALIHHDAVNRLLRGRRGAWLTALTSGGAIPDNADYRVLLEPENQFIGTVNEDFAVESLAGDVFLLGNRSYRIRRVERGTVRVEDAAGQAPTIPFWLGEAPGRSDELSLSVSGLREALAVELERGDPVRWLIGAAGIDEVAARELTEHLAGARAALGCLPTQRRLVIERFFDEAGGMQLVIHAPFGSRLNRAFGLALRKRFCRRFNFELQAAATEDNIVLSLTAMHSFELAEVSGYLRADSVREVLIQALLDAPMFLTRWRWVAGVSLALPRFRGGKKVPPQFLRMEAEDLIAAVFPDQLACAENLTGEREIPDHPLVRQAIGDCLTEAMDVSGLERLLAGIESGAIEVVTRELTQPSPLALEVLSARPYAYLDDAPLEERRTQAVMNRRWGGGAELAAFGRLDAEAIARVRAEAWPDARSADELHDALVWLGALNEAEVEAGQGWREFLAGLAREGRVAFLKGPSRPLWIATERAAPFRALWPDAVLEPPPAVTSGEGEDADAALVALVRGRLEGLGPVTAAALAEAVGLRPNDALRALAALEAEGFALRGRFSPLGAEEEWCERRLLARIHHYTVKRLRSEIEPVALRDYLRFLLRWQRVTADTRMEGRDALEAVIGQLEGFEAPAAAWESEILPARLVRYDPTWLDDLCLAGRVSWARFRPPAARAGGGDRTIAPVRTTPITLLSRRNARHWEPAAPAKEALAPGARGRQVIEHLRSRGASFFDELVEGSGLLRTEVEEALAELVALGLVSSDSFGGLRALLVPAERRGSLAAQRCRHRAAPFTMEDAGRWALVRRHAATATSDQGQAVEHVACTLLRRYGVVFGRLIEREAGWLPPWRDLLRAYRRLEARGEIRGGRFVAGFAGEQFALPDAIGLLREVRRKPESGAFVALSGADPLNLVGILTGAPKLASLTGNRLLYRDGLPVAFLIAGEARVADSLDPALHWEARKVLLRQPPLGPRAARREMAPA
jgi:ATP-dependent Lhr-like helicase